VLAAKAVGLEFSEDGRGGIHGLFLDAATLVEAVEVVQVF